MSRDQPFTFFMRFILKENRKWWDMMEYVDFQYTREEFILEIVKRQNSLYDLMAWLTMHPARWADFVNTFEIEYKERN